jgi:UDP-N-acetylmuramate dehydrogenase
VSVGRLSADAAEAVRAAFGDRLRQGVSLAGYTSARLGGPADYLLVVRSAADLAEAAQRLWEARAPFRVLGSGSNVLVADAGVREVVIVNEARQTRFEAPEATVWAESGASLGVVARLAAERGWSGLEWAATVPGTVGGAVVGNAGAHGSDMAHTLALAEILQHGEEPAVWTADRLAYDYRESWLKRNPGRAVVLSATFRLERSDPGRIKARMAEFTAHRQQTQPPGASMGSMFRNPPGDFAGRLIEAAGLKGSRVGMAEISRKHANFFINLGGATSGDVWALIQQARSRVEEQSGVRLELEVELLGEWAPTVEVSRPAGREGS